MKGPENIAHQVTGYTDAKNAKVSQKTGSEHLLLLSSSKAVTSGAANSKNASVRFKSFKIIQSFRMHKHPCIL
jgi:hypothetical protein